MSDVANVDLPGITVSMWMQDCSAINLFSIQDVNDVYNSFGLGFGPRCRCFSLGINLYMGERLSTMTTQSPNQGRGKGLIHADYYRKYYSYAEKRLTPQSKLRHAGKAVIDLFRRVNDNYLSFVGYKTCNRAIWTSGITSKRIYRQWLPSNKSTPTWTEEMTTLANYLGFCNSPHRDLTDMVKDGTVDRWIGAIGEQSLMKGYVEKLQRQIGVGLPTTCGYNLVGDIGPNRNNHTVGEEPFVVAAWGRSGGSSHAESRVT